MNAARRELNDQQWMDALGIDSFWIVDDLSQSATETLKPVATKRVVEIATESGGQDQGLNQDLNQAILLCKRCDLARSRKHAVPGSGDLQADWLLVGEAPGEEEDKAGLPFVGQSGKLLDAMLAALGLDRNKGVYLTNAVKCRPTQNHTPESAEIDACNPYLNQQIAQIQPKVILALGRPAAYAVLGQEASIQSMRGTVHYRQQEALKIPVVVTYHPAYLLREPAEKWKAWQDLLLARATLS